MKKIILEYETGVLMRKGKLVQELQPGQVKYSRVFRKERVEVFDARPTFTVAGDNFMTKDQLSVYLSVNLSYAIVSATQYLKMVVEPYGLIRIAANDLIRAWVARLDLDELLEKHASLQGDLEKQLAPELKQYGLELKSVSPPVITLARGLKQAVEAKLIASKKSQADLEEARGRTAVLRHYANAARLIEDNPEVLKLLLGQKAKSLQVQFADNPKSAKK